ncbi:MAG TPA: site-specific integrase [Chthoniobacterales bacterium]|nr:site-specific integrase [Chthoniobacterales bacterium]
MEVSHFSVAKAKLATFLKEHREQSAQKIDPANAKMIFSEAAELHKQRLAQDVSLKKRTREYWNEVLAALLKSWPALHQTEVRKITPAACREWAAKYAKGSSATRFNNTIAILRHVLDVAVESGVIYSNPATSLTRKPVRQKTLELPTRSQFELFILQMATGHSRDSQNCADLAAGLAFTGCRKGEAAEVERRDLDSESGMIVVRGSADEGTKNSEIRRIPMIAEARQPFERMLAARHDESATAKVFLVRECQKSMNRAAKRVGMPRITHHDLRHFFATVCIESGVDVPTVSRWLGHKDDGALAMKTYGHLRDEHSTAAARKVTFTPTAKGGSSLAP